MDKCELIYEYEQILLGKKKNFSSILFNNSQFSNPCDKTTVIKKRKDTESNQKNALIIFKYAIEKLLCWTPKEVETYLTYDILEKLKLCPLLQYLYFPPELSKTKDVNYIAHLVYPNIIHVDEKKLCIQAFRKILLSPKSKDFPKDYFLNAEGFIRASICLQYIINNYIMPSNIQQLYSVFSIKDDVDEILDHYKLLQPCYTLFDNPIDYLHYSLPETQRSSFWYNFYKFQYEYLYA